MKVNWFSPLPPAKTEIANHTARLLPVLAARAEVTLWTDQPQWEPALERCAVVRRYQPQVMSWPELNRGQASFFNIGNNVHFHSSIWEVARRHPGVVILHDQCLQHFFSGLYLAQRQDRDGYIAQMVRYYGREGRRAANEFLGGRLSIDHLCAAYPLTLLALENALGVLVHTRPSLEAVQQQGLPVTCCPLPYAATSFRHGGQSLAAEESAARSGPPYQLIVFGHIGSNRRLDALLQALAQLADRDAFRLDVYGKLHDPEHFRARVRELSLSTLVTLHGFVPDEALEKALRTAHLAVNLRFPTMGEASASQLRIWDYALPSLVTQVGWYAGLPEDAVVFVRPDREIPDIHGHLRSFLDDPARFRNMGRCGRRYLEQHHTPEAYVETIVHFTRTVRGLRNAALTSLLIERTGAEMSAWTDPSGPKEIFRQPASQIAMLALQN